MLKNIHIMNQSARVDRKIGNQELRKLCALDSSFEIPILVSLTLSGSLGSTVIEEKKG